MQLRSKRKIYKEKYKMFAWNSQTLRNKRHFVISVIAINVFYCIFIWNWKIMPFQIKIKAIEFKKTRLIPGKIFSRIFSWEKNLK